MCPDKQSNFYIAQLGPTLMGERKIFQNVCDWQTVNENPAQSVPNWNIIFIDSDGNINKRNEEAKAQAKEKQQRQRQREDKNNGTKDIFISIILIMTPESKQKAGRVTHTPHPEAEALLEGGRP